MGVFPTKHNIISTNQPTNLKQIVLFLILVFLVSFKLRDSSENLKVS